MAFVLTGSILFTVATSGIFGQVKSRRITMFVKKVMSSPVIRATAGTTIREAAEQMRGQRVGALPVFRDCEVVGIVTDRDIIIRALAATGFALGPDTRVTDIMSCDVITCYEDQDVAEAAAVMGERRVRRLLVMDRSGVSVGILSLGDISEHVSEELAGQALGEISEARAHDAQR